MTVYDLGLTFDPSDPPPDLTNGGDEPAIGNFEDMLGGTWVEGGASDPLIGVVENYHYVFSRSVTGRVTGVPDPFTATTASVRVAGTVSWTLDFGTPVYLPECGISWRTTQTWDPPHYDPDYSPGGSPPTKTSTALMKSRWGDPPDDYTSGGRRWTHWDVHDGSFDVWTKEDIGDERPNTSPSGNTFDFTAPLNLGAPTGTYNVLPVWDGGLRLDVGVLVGVSGLPEYEYAFEWSVSLTALQLIVPSPRRPRTSVGFLDW